MFRISIFLFKKGIGVHIHGIPLNRNFFSLIRSEGKSSWLTDDGLFIRTDVGDICQPIFYKRQIAAALYIHTA